MYKPVVLIILDGFGISGNIQGNAIAQANTPTINNLWRFYPALALQAAGIAVGLRWREMGNSEIGHLTIGAGRIIYQNLVRISLSIQNKSFFTNPVILRVFEHIQNYNSGLHLMGLVSNGGVHSHIEHLYALIELAKMQNTQKLFIHCFTDGRDTMPRAGINFITTLKEGLESIGLGKIATVCGRYWAMDRNNNWSRTEKAYDCLVKGEGEQASNPIEVLKRNYEKEIGDEFIPPTAIIDNTTGKPIGLVSDNDVVIFFNFREDRARQLTKAFVLKNFDKFNRERQLENLYFVTMTEYEEGLPAAVAFTPQYINWPLGKVLSHDGKKQLRITETEKYAHVTYFFNGGQEKVFDKEDRILIPSPQVSTFDKAPEMSAYQITERAVKEIERGVYDFIVVNFANPDMVAHTGNFQAAKKAIETVDQCLAQIIQVANTYNAALFITADHGNAEDMINLQTGEMSTDHSANPVPLWLVTPDNQREKSQDEILEAQNQIRGIIADIAPTILEFMNIKKPAEMTGQSLLGLLK